jgi:VanZ family protein
MGPFFQRLCANKLLPVIWTLLTIVLLCLPGSSIPGGPSWFEIPHFDKYVHITLFGGIALFWGGYYAFRWRTVPAWRKVVIWLAIVSIVLGIVLEFVQLYWIPDRSFDGFDIIADSTGAILAALFLLFVYPGNKVRS